MMLLPQFPEEQRSAGECTSVGDDLLSDQQGVFKAYGESVREDYIAVREFASTIN